MGQRLGEQDGYPVGVDNSHPHFHGGDDDIECPDCHRRIAAEPGAECACGYVVDEDFIRDSLDAVGEPDEDWGSDR